MPATDPLLTDPDAVRGCVAHRACVMHEGRAHLIETPDAGCRTHIEVPLEAVRALAEGARLAAPPLRGIVHRIGVMGAHPGVW